MMLSWKKCLILLLYVLSEGLMVPDEEEEESSEKKKVVNFASVSAGAVVLEASAQSTKFHNLLNDDKDKYGMTQCSEKKWVVIGLSEDILIEQIVMINYERYSSTLETFQVLGSTSYPVSEWMDLGTFSATPELGEQTFDLPNPAWGRYLKFRFLTHHGNEFYCTLSQIKVHGSTVIENLKREVDRSTQEVLHLDRVMQEGELDEQQVEPISAFIEHDNSSQDNESIPGIEQNFSRSNVVEEGSVKSTGDANSSKQTDRHESESLNISSSEILVDGERNETEKSMCASCNTDSDGAEQFSSQVASHEDGSEKNSGASECSSCLGSSPESQGGEDISNSDTASHYKSDDMNAVSNLSDTLPEDLENETSSQTADSQLNENSSNEIGLSNDIKDADDATSQVAKDSMDEEMQVEDAGLRHPHLPSRNAANVDNLDSSISDNVPGTESISESTVRVDSSANIAEAQKVEEFVPTENSVERVSKKSPEDKSNSVTETAPKSNANAHSNEAESMTEQDTSRNEIATTNEENNGSPQNLNEINVFDDAERLKENSSDNLHEADINVVNSTREGNFVLNDEDSIPLPDQAVAEIDSDKTLPSGLDKFKHEELINVSDAHENLTEADSSGTEDGKLTDDSNQSIHLAESAIVDGNIDHPPLVDPTSQPVFSAAKGYLNSESKLNEIETDDINVDADPDEPRNSDAEINAPVDSSVASSDPHEIEKQSSEMTDESSAFLSNIPFDNVQQDSILVEDVDNKFKSEESGDLDSLSHPHSAHTSSISIESLGSMKNSSLNCSQQNVTALSNITSNATMSSTAASPRIRSLSTCLESLKFAEFQAKMRAKFDTSGNGVGNVGMGGSASMPSIGNSDVFRTLMQKIISLEQNSRIFELYTVQINECFQTFFRDIENDQQKYEELLGEKFQENERNSLKRQEEMLSKVRQAILNEAGSILNLTLNRSDKSYPTFNSASSHVSSADVSNGLELSKYEVDVRGWVQQSNWNGHLLKTLEKILSFFMDLSKPVPIIDVILVGIFLLLFLVITLFVLVLCTVCFIYVKHKQAEPIYLH